MKTMMMRTLGNNNNKKKNEDHVQNDYDGSLKKGPWTPDEDAILIEYVKTYGEGNWNSVPKNSGLSRCGKSCRLRWANHLRPNLKKGAFSPEEERIIVDLHAKLGNKWARMASQLPGRTDNEIKNFWNTRIKRRERAGLPIYPPEVIRDATLYHIKEEQYFEKPYNSSLSSPLLLSSSSYHTNFNLSNRYPSLKNQPISLYGPSSNLFNKNGFLLSNNSVMPPLAPCSVSSSQATLDDSVTPPSSNVSGVDAFIEASTKDNNEKYEVAAYSGEGRSSSVLLGALVVESGISVSGNNNTRSEDSTAAAAAGKSSNKRKSIMIEENEEERGTTVESAFKKNKNSAKTSTETPTTSSGKKETAKEAPMEEIDVSWDDDLCSLLNNFPSSSEMPTPEWYSTSTSSGGDNKAQSSNAPAPPSGWNIVGTTWNNMPSIC